MLELSFDAPGDRVCQLGTAPCRVQSIAFLGSRERQRAHPTGDRSQIENRRLVRLPVFEWPPLHELEQDPGVESIGLRTLQQRAPEIPRSRRVDHHHFDPGRSMQRQGQVQVVDARRLEAHTGRMTRSDQLPNQPLVALRVVRQRGDLGSPFDRDRDLIRADIGWRRARCLTTVPLHPTVGGGRRRAGGRLLVARPAGVVAYWLARGRRWSAIR
jgi:hypothetical protein